MKKILLASLVFFLLAAGFWMREHRKSEFLGKEFAAELTTIDGKTFSMPKDTLGKVVVIDFWASWCPPCRELIPHMKQLHEKYKGKDLVIVGISLDTDKDALTKFIAGKNLSWIQTYSGKGWKDPTAQQYGIDEIPSVWVIGKDGRVVSTNAVSNTSGIIDKALKD